MTDIEEIKRLIVIDAAAAQIHLENMKKATNHSNLVMKFDLAVKEIGHMRALLKMLEYEIGK